MLLLGIDQHARQLTISLREENGDVIQARNVSTQLDDSRYRLAALASRGFGSFSAISSRIAVARFPSPLSCVLIT